jgi:hypothetical protein
MLRLRELEQGGRFSHLDPQQQHDLRILLGFHGRAAAVKQLLGGYRRRGIEIYLREFSDQLRLGSWAFLCLFPILTLTPGSILRRKWTEAIK